MRPVWREDYTAARVQPASQARPAPVARAIVGKRLFDVAGAILGLAFLAPLFLLVGAFIKFASPGPVFFRHKRFGYGGRPFYVWKFRTLHVGADPQVHQRYVRSLLQGDGSLQKLREPALLAPLGGWLRSTAIDELPQLLNVLAGEMSLVGPRPDVVPPQQYEAWQQVRFQVLPGMTGLWQVSGKNDTTFNEMMRLDADYVRRRSWLLDLRILLLTGPAIVRQIVDHTRG